MSWKVKRILIWVKWIGISLLLLPVLGLLLIKIFGVMEMRMDDIEIMDSIAPGNQSRMDTLNIGDRHISYLLTSKGEKKNQAIVFVHGSPGSMDAYIKYMSDNSLLEIADLVTYDRPGFGHSDFGRTENSLRKQAWILSDLMDSLGYERYWLVGHSYGGPIIVQAAIDHPATISGLVVVAGSVSYELEPKSPWRKWIDFPGLRYFLPTAMRVSNQELMTLKPDLLLINSEWGKIGIPVSLIHGTKDMLVPFGNLAEAKSKLVNSSNIRKLILENENHFILWTHHEHVVREILGLMKPVQ
ncbi:MAG: alpha/beta hydrolase [Bacteroidota bacterium]|nr:alpha/beta hydrolase [Bacteroidota bacterium]